MEIGSQTEAGPNGTLRQRVLNSMDKTAKSLIDNLKKEDGYLIAISRKVKDKIQTYCVINEFPTGDLPMAREDISTLIHNTYLKDSVSQSSDIDDKIKAILEEDE